MDFIKQNYDYETGQYIIECIVCQEQFLSKKGAKYCSPQCKSLVAVQKKSELDMLWTHERLSFTNNLRVLKDLVGDKPVGEELSVPLYELTRKHFDFTGLGIMAKFAQKWGEWKKIGPFAFQVKGDKSVVIIFKCS